MFYIFYNIYNICIHVSRKYDYNYVYLFVLCNSFLFKFYFLFEMSVKIAKVQNSNYIQKCKIH